MTCNHSATVLTMWRKSKEVASFRSQLSLSRMQRSMRSTSATEHPHSLLRTNANVFGIICSYMTTTSRYTFNNWCTDNTHTRVSTRLKNKIQQLLHDFQRPGIQISTRKAQLAKGNARQRSMCEGPVWTKSNTMTFHSDSMADDA